MNPPEGPAAPASGTPDIPTFETLAADPEIAPLLDFEPVHRKVKRPDGWFPELQRELIARMASTGTLQEAVTQMGKHATGAEALYKTPAADSFRVAWDAALAIGRRRNGLDSQPPFTGEVPGITRRKKSPSLPKGNSAGEGWGEGLPGQILNEHGEYEDESSYRRRVADAVDSIGAKLVRCRRAFLAEISGSPGKRAAFEILTELPVDWDLAARLEPQPFEPWTPTNQRQPDMVLTAESGWQSGIVPYGPAKVAEMRAAINQHRADEGLEPIRWDGEELAPPRACLGEGNHAEHGGGVG